MILPVRGNTLCLPTGKVAETPSTHKRKTHYFALWSECLQHTYNIFSSTIAKSICHIFCFLFNMCTISLRLLPILPISHQCEQSVSCSCILDKLGKPSNVSNFWECCRRMYPNTAIIVVFLFIYQFCFFFLLLLFNSH